MALNEYPTVGEVFTPDEDPTYTFVSRSDDDSEALMREVAQAPRFVVSLSGPSKSGKTVIVRRIFGEDLIEVTGSNLATPENQRRELEAIAQHRGWEIVAVYEDQGISGAKGRDKRPQFEWRCGPRRAVALLGSSEVAVVSIYRLLQHVQTSRRAIR